MTEVHLEPRHLVMIEQMLQEFIPEARVWCFGSRVHGRGLKRFSDLDCKTWKGYIFDWLKQEIFEEYVVSRNGT